MNRALLPAVAVVSAVTVVAGVQHVAAWRPDREPFAARSSAPTAREGTGAPSATDEDGAPVPAAAGSSSSAPSSDGASASAADDDPPAVPSEQVTRWRWPMAPAPPVLRRFRAPPDPYAAGHRGLDLGGAWGTPVLAVADGRVSHSGVVAGRGTVTVLHAGGLRSSYEPVDPVVSEGDVVRAGQVLGRMAPSGTSHCGVRPCLHLGARRAATYVDPWPLLVGGRIVLLPMGRGP